MHFVEKEPSQKRLDFDQKLKSNKILRVPGAYNPLTAKLIEEIGYDAVYVSGGVMANDLGFPDIGLTTLQDVSTRSYLISRVTNLPTIVGRFVTLEIKYDLVLTSCSVVKPISGKPRSLAITPPDT